MKLLVDEGVDHPVLQALREEGYDARSVREEMPGANDEAVVSAANESEALLVTEDKDFGELVFRQGRVPRGVILIRLHGFSPEEKAEWVLWAFNNFSWSMVQVFTVVGPNSVRNRPMGPLGE